MKPIGVDNIRNTLCQQPSLLLLKRLLLRLYLSLLLRLHLSNLVHMLVIAPNLFLVVHFGFHITYGVALEHFLRRWCGWCYTYFLRLLLELQELLLSPCLLFA